MSLKETSPSIEEQLPHNAEKLETIATNDVDADGSLEDRDNYLTGKRFYLLNTAFAIGLFLVALDLSIVTTALVSISNEFQSLERSSWVLTSYMLSYTGLLVISAKLAVLFGRKLCILLFLALFTIFSGACAAAQSMTQLYILAQHLDFGSEADMLGRILLRAVQGIGAAGTNAIIVVVLFELVPPSKFANNTAVVAMVFAAAFLMGPLVGGAISERTTWRWIFLINVPTGALVFLAILIALPRGFPYHGMPHLAPRRAQPASKRDLLKEHLGRIDFTGAALLLVASVCLVAALEEVNSQFSWQSAAIIVLLAISGVAWIGFFAWSWHSRGLSGAKDPVFPWRFMTSRLCVGVFLLSAMTGAPLVISVINFPLRFQTAFALSPLQAGIRLLPLTVAVPIGSTICSVLLGKAKMPPIYLTFFGSILQIISFALMAALPDATQLSKSFYGFEAMAGFGIGFVFATVTLVTPFTVEARDRAIANSVTMQIRMLGGVVGLAVTATILNDYVRSHLSRFLGAANVNALLQSTEAFAHLPPTTVEQARDTFSKAYTVQLWVIMGFSIAQVPVNFLLWKRKQLTV